MNLDVNFYKYTVLLAIIILLIIYCHLSKNKAQNSLKFTAFKITLGLLSAFSVISTDFFKSDRFATCAEIYITAYSFLTIVDNFYEVSLIKRESFQEPSTKITTMDKLIENFNESKGFYKMVKRQTYISLFTAVTFLLVGLVIYSLGFISIFYWKKDITAMSLISGSFVELISGTAFWLHNKSIKELNEFHKRLSSTERYLTSIMLADKLDNNSKTKSYIWILENCILTDIEIQTGKILKWRHESKN